ncbi:hypothetical protein RB195_013996 [Necator americanus]|uniref:Fibronectin type-III domain-containing protein n=1 Tax=Necator americanus TaxID=51031 RepID=A0ABR1DY71_NECAM
MQSGSPSAVYCNCPVERTHRTCNSVDQKLARALTLPTPSSFSSEYLDAHTIRLQIPPYPSAFAYIFEYATVSTQSEEWYFAGSSTTPMTMFTVLDPCRDYKFRVIVVVRSANPTDHIVIFGQKIIPVQLPPFVLAADQVFAEPPIFNTTTDTLKVYIRWTLPRGYSDSDIYGYEAPALYPLQCHTPEDELPQPKIEIVRAGGRLAVSLPSTVLEARCRLWVEVRMLPRCVRLEPFSVQKNIEIDCDKNPELDVCSKEANPICMEVLEVRGKQGHATITWMPAPRTPLYYHLRYGPAHMKGNPPFVTWQLATKRDIKVDGTVTTLTLDVAEDQDFGVQVCAILTSHRKRPKFGLVRVTPFQCTSCNHTSTLPVGRCGECGRIEGTTVADKSWKAASGSGRQVSDAHRNHIPHTVFRMETDLFVKGHNRASGSNISVAQVNTHAAEAPISLERAEEINDQATSTTSFSMTSFTSTTSTTSPTSSKSSTTALLTAKAETTASPETGIEEEETSSTEVATTTEATITETTSLDEDGEKHENTTTTDVEVVDVETLLQHTEQTTTTAFRTTTTKETHQTKSLHVEDSSSDKENEDDLTAVGQHLSTELEESVKHLEKALEEVEVQKERKWNFEESTSLPSGVVPLNTTLAELAVHKAATEIVNKIGATSSELRHHEKSKKCLLSTGIVCNFGCETSKTCRCPLISHVLSPEGGCLSRDSFGHTLCLPKSDVNATWDAASMNVLVRSQEASDHIRSVNNADHLFVEFGRVREETMHPNSSPTMLRFDEPKRNRMVVEIEKLIRSGSFSTEPFVFHVNNSIIADAAYGMRFCTFNSTQVKDPYSRNWDLDIVSNRIGNIVQVTQLSPVHFTNDLRSEMVLRPSRETFWNAFFVIGKVIVLVVLKSRISKDFLSQGDWHTEEDPDVDYEMLLRGLRACAERALKPRTTNLDRISKTTKELLERRRTFGLDPNASHIERQRKILETAQRRTSLAKCRRDLHEYNILLAALLSKDGTRTSPRRETEIITERFYLNILRSSTPMSSPIIPSGEAPPRILPSEVRIAVKSMKPGTAPGHDFISADFLRAGAHLIHVILTAHMTS